MAQVVFSRSSHQRQTRVHSASLGSNLRHRASRFSVFAGVLLLCACNPTLNWRRVPLGDMAVTLPCKPDHTQRSLPWGGQALEMEMVGCEADGALFAASRIHLPPGADPSQLQAQWQAASLQQMKAQGVPKLEPLTTHVPAMASQQIAADGQGSDGKALQARLAWVVSGGDLYHLAVYAARVSPEMAEPFFDGMNPQ